jgi:hypothetical protein
MKVPAPCVHDLLGREAQAVPFDLAALSGYLSTDIERSWPDGI